MNPWIERTYRHLPVWAQNLAVTAFGIGYRSQRLGGDFEEYVKGFRLRDRWGPEQMDAFVVGQLRRVLMHAFEQVPYYQRRWREAGIETVDLETIDWERFRRLPQVPKNDLRKDPRVFLARDIATTQKLFDNPSSGSTGTPIIVTWTSDVRRRLTAARAVRSFEWAGTSVRRPRSMLGGRTVVPDPNSRGPFHRCNLAERQIYFSAYHLSPDRACQYVAALNRYRPKVLTGYAHSHYFLARYMLQQDLRLDYQPEALILGSEPLNGEMKATLQQAFGARAYEEYGSVENCVLATECEAGCLHVSPDFGVLEILDEAGNPVAAGEPGRVVCTGLLNDVQPLIRYQIGDLASWAPGTCACGRVQMPVLQSVEGRIEDVVVGPDGRELVRFHSVFYGLGKIVEAQVVQETLRRLRVKVVTTEELDEAESSLMRRRVVQRLGDVEVIVERVQSIPRNSRGKFRAVVSLISEEERRRAREVMRS